ncbi:6-phosphofructokinase [Natranaerofaba carboxydovora]|uniref:6-phosphofructokinase n=1 Tax=Natranaerofaba carboxydovora TaxID=2742683 RepID=UPI001F13E2BA|nr:6-phosphofructokinase [Natranaerofaba carboxydovora]UMZ72807.1 ATP-dependent 6-phosphofructokinase [Natranaerofaba carboxydovora]
MEKIGVLTSGGDAPGMNAAIRAAVRRCIYLNKKAVGIYYGFKGLIENNFKELKIGDVGDVLQRGGTVLSTARCDKFKSEEGQKTALYNLNEANIDGLIVIGGDGSFRGAKKLGELGFPVVGVPGTIDNDIPNTELTIGFDTAVNTVIETIDKIRDTATSHERIFIIEVMGRDSGNIALWAGTAGGAESILIPEQEYDIDVVINKILKGINRGKKHSIIVAAEGVGPASKLSNTIKEKAGLENRVSVLGHVQRGGSPTARDRILGSCMGAKAVDQLVNNTAGVAIVKNNGKITTANLDEVIFGKKAFSKELLVLNNSLSI